MAEDRSVGPDAGTTDDPLDIERRAALEALLRGASIGPDASLVATSLERVELSRGSVLFEQGQAGDCLYVVARGRIRVEVASDRDGPAARDLCPGELLGEMALITGEPRQATAVAARDTVLYRLSADVFERTWRGHPAVAQHLVMILARRLAQPPRRAPHPAPPRTIALVPAGTGAPVRVVAEAMASVLGQAGRVALATTTTVDDVLGAGAGRAPLGSAVGERTQVHLDDLESSHDHLLLVADEDSAWGRRCVRQADLVLLVAAAGAPARLNPLERELFADPATVAVQLVVVEASEATPSGTDRWLAGRRVERTHHVVLDRPADLGRLARFLVGRPVGLVLSGGAVRALAHVGVARALAEAGIPIDTVAATSAGAIIGAQLAMGWSAERVDAYHAVALAGPRRRLLDVVPPTTSLVGGTRFNRFLDEMFGATTFDDLWLSFLCTSTDLTAVTSVVHRRGPLRPAVRASCALPILMPPVVGDGHLLADGGITNNLPVDPLLATGPVGTLVAVNVTAAFYDADEPYNYTDALTTRRIINSRLNPFAARLVAPGILDVLMRSLEIGSKGLEASQVAKADLCVRPDVAGIGFTNVARRAELVDAGYRAAAAAIEQWEDRPAIPFT